MCLSRTKKLYCSCQFVNFYEHQILNRKNIKLFSNLYQNKFKRLIKRNNKNLFKQKNVGKDINFPKPVKNDLL